MDGEHYRELAKLLHDADVNGVLRGMGHLAPDADLDDAMREVEHAAPLRPGNLAAWAEGFLPQVRIGSNLLDPGFAAIVGPFGVQPLRDPEDARRLLRVRELNLNYAIASLSLAYLSATSESTRLGERDPGTARERLAGWGGLTVVWPSPEEIVAME